MENNRLIPIILSTTPFLHRRKEVTKFLGIEVDGRKSEMIKKLEQKGFIATSTLGGDILEGKFKGYNVYLCVVECNDKVCSIVVRDKNAVCEADIKRRFNNLCRKFENSSRYISIGDFKIPRRENLSYEMLENKKRYSAAFYQSIRKIDIDKVKDEVKSIISKTNEQIEHLDVIEKECENFILEYALGLLVKKSVTISMEKLDVGYVVSMSFDNQYNIVGNI